MTWLWRKTCASKAGAIFIADATQQTLSMNVNKE
jgi:hypothetical protein